MTETPVAPPKATLGQRCKAILKRLFCRKQPSNWAQIVGAIAAIVAGGLAYTAYTTAKSQKRAELAIEMSKQLLADREMRHGYDLLLNGAPSTAIDDSFLAKRAYIDMLNYLANLAIAGQIDNAFVSWRVKCDLYHVGVRIAAQSAAVGDIRDIKAYVKNGMHGACPDLPVPSH